MGNEHSRTRTAIGLLLGAWLAGIVIVAWIAAENFWIVDRLLLTSTHPVFHRDVGLLPPGEARALLRYLVSEQNRLYFVWWGWIEVALGVIALAPALALMKRRIFLAIALMLAITLVMQIYFVPRIVDIGRALDFVPRDPEPPRLSTFGWLHAAYSALDVIKLVLGVWAVSLLFKRERPPADAPAEKAMEGKDGNDGKDRQPRAA